MVLECFCEVSEASQPSVNAKQASLYVHLRVLGSKGTFSTRELLAAFQADNKASKLSEYRDAAPKFSYLDLK